MLRIHFTSADLGRIRVVTALDPMWETVLSLHQIIQPHPFFAWRRHTRRLLHDADLAQDVALLAALSPPSDYFPDFLTPPGHTGDFNAGVEAVLSTGKQRLRAEIERLGVNPSSVPGWLDDVRAGRPAALRRLGTALVRYHKVALAPCTAEASAIAAADVAGHAHKALAHGIEAVLASLGPGARWQPPVLEVDYPLDQWLHLEGRGLYLVPSFFGVFHPISLADPQLQPVLVYPVHRQGNWRPGGAGAPAADALGELMGETRARVLRLLDEELTTTVLAGLARTSPSSVSRHTAALRRSGLVTTRRLGGSVRHRRTALGSALVHSR
ncbi:ArsR/SmtB family transcription factor [Streptomyces sp. NPDC055099]